MIDDEPPPHVGEVRFGEDFHDLLHPVWARSCGDRRLHLRRAWEYRWKEGLRAATLCRLGRHRVGKSWRRTSPTSEDWRMEFRCYDCGKLAPLEKL